MRIWDIHPGYLNRQSLLGEHRELHGIVSVILSNKKGYARHPETLRWKMHLSGLAVRHDLLVAEMALRGFQHHSPLPPQDAPVSWPETFIDPPAKQFVILAEKYKEREPGRIPLPASAQILWAQHKYSVLARDPEYYKAIGPKLAHPAKPVSLNDLASELVDLLRQPPSPGRLTNALLHMWGYVSQFESGEKQRQIQDDPAMMLKEIQRLATEHGKTYLMHSTALSELAVWGA